VERGAVEKGTVERLERLVIRAQKGEVEAYTVIVSRFEAMAVGYAFAILGDRHLAQDAAQDAFVQAYQDLERLDDSKAFPGWFRRIVFKHCDRIRRKRRHPLLPPETLGQVRSWGPTPEEDMEAVDKRRQAVALVQALAPKDRQIVALYYLDRYSRQEIAAFLGVPLATIISRLRSVRKRLKERSIIMNSLPARGQVSPGEFAEKVKFDIEKLSGGSGLVWLRGAEGDFPVFLEAEAYGAFSDRIEGKGGQSLSERLLQAYLKSSGARLEEVRLVSAEGDTTGVELVFATAGEKVCLGTSINNEADGADLLALALMSKASIYASLGVLKAEVSTPLPFGREIKHLMEKAKCEAARLGHGYLGTEHLLLAMLTDGGEAADLITRQGVSLAQVIRSVEDYIGPSNKESGYTVAGHLLLPLTPRTRSAFDTAAVLAQKQGAAAMGVGHLFLALAADKESVSAQILTGFGLDYKNLQGQMKMAG
jgi:RNA polymerase sigma factor (sigma-70 family)